MSFLMVAGALAVLGAAAWGWQKYTEAGPLAETKTFIVEKGRGVSAIAAGLEAEGIVSSGLLFRAGARFSKKHTALKAGEYEFTAGMPMEAVLEKIVRGDVVQRRVTFREGLTSWQAVQILNVVELLSGDVTAVPPEGTLLPDTYQFERGDTRQSVLDQMARAMTAALDSLWAARMPDTAITTKEQAVTLASIVEKETGVPGERARIAGVFLNRLRRGMPLQSDPTVIYAITKGEMQDQGQGPIGRRLLRDDLKLESPYNTYLHAGLPPGPIANPGIDSLRAVLQPESHDFLYFVADGTGGHVFATTLEEHNRNVAKWREVRRQSGQ